MTASSLADLVPYAASRIFRPDFLRLVVANAHRTYLEDIGLLRHVGPASTIQDLLERVYDEMARGYRSEYLYKNEVIRRLVIARHKPERTTVLLEKPIARWASRLDMLVVNDTTTAYEIKTDHDDLERVRKQTDLALEAFDHVFVACSERWASAVESTVDERVGIVAMKRRGTFARVRPAADNAHNVKPQAVLPLLHRAEYTAAIERHVGPVPTLNVATHYDVCSAMFSRLSGETAHKLLLAALKARFVTAADKDTLQGLPYGLAHLHYKIAARERPSLLSPAVLGRTVA
jgi:hypothetical protein